MKPTTFSHLDHSALSHRLAFIYLLAIGLLITITSESASGFSSDDPQVQALIKSGLKRLEKNLKAPTIKPVNEFWTGGSGEHSLAGYGYYKATHDPNHPVVKQGIQTSRRFVSSLGGRDPGGIVSATVYSAAVATLLFAEVDPDKYRNELKRLETYFRQVQFPGGGYGYKGTQLGDVSQTQYAILALWTLDNSGVIIDYDGVARTIKWLLRVQDPSGGWPYLGQEPRGNSRQKQKDVRLSMALAGGSAVLIAGDILRLWGERGNNTRGAYPGLPKAVSEFQEGMDNLAVNRPKLPTEPIISAISECSNYVRLNQQGKVEYPYYNIYTIERYESFRELALKLPSKPGAAWYDSNVSYLMKNQDEKGGWPASNPYVSSSTTTSFALLFLMRSTQKAIEKASSGALAGGQGLPSDTTQIKVEGTSIKGKAVSGAVTDLLDILEGDEADSLEGKSIPDNLKLANDPKDRKAQIDRMERLVRGSQSWQARRVACRLLGQSDEMRVVPTLIFALTDRDSMVKRYARDGLRFISRKFEGYGMPDKPTDSDVNQAQRAWRDWYRTMDPAYIFVDYDL